MTDVNRKLEFPVRKSSRRQKNVTPRKRPSKDDVIDDENDDSGFKTPSPSKKKREGAPIPARRDETPTRTSLAAKLATASLKDKDYCSPKKEQRLPLSPVKVQSQNILSSPHKSPVKALNLSSFLDRDSRPSSRSRQTSPVKAVNQVLLPGKVHGQLCTSPIKASCRSNSPAKTVQRLNSPAKTIQRLNSPAKTVRQLSSPVKTGNRLNSPIRSSDRISSPVKSSSLLLRSASPVKTPTKSARKSLAMRSPLKSPTMRLDRPDCKAYHAAKQMFHTAKPERLIGRDKETAEVRAFLKGHMSKKTAGSLYISGAPGTGKTAVLTHIIDDLKGVHSCKTVYLNCMTLDNSATVYGKLYSDITGKNAPTAKERLRVLERVLTSDGPSIILVLDEIDQLDSKNQEILYTIFEWPTLKKSRLILVGIANALDLTDRVLPRLQARPKCRPRLLNFAPYTKDQISAILKDRVKDLETEGISVVDGTAIQFCARKISAVAGDMRKALDVCRRAVELVETDIKSQRVLKASDAACTSPRKQQSKSQSPNIPKKIGIVHINNVLSDVYGSGAAAQQQETIPLQQKLVVCSLLLMLKQGKAKEVTAGKLHEVYCKICKKRQMAPVDFSEFQGVLTLLESRGMVRMKTAKENRLNKVALKLDEKELEHTMQDKVLISAIINDGIPK